MALLLPSLLSFPLHPFDFDLVPTAAHCRGGAGKRGAKRGRWLEAEGGAHIEWPLPGYGAAELTAERLPDSQELRLASTKKGASFEHVVRVPEGLDAARASVSLVDGIVRVAAPEPPKPAKVAVPVEAGAPMSDETQAGAAFARRFEVPGFAASDLTASAEDGAVTVAGRSAAGFGEARLSIALPARAEPAKGKLLVEHGVAVLVVPLSERPAPTPLAVAGAPAEAGAQASESEELLRVALPGFAAADVEATLAPDGRSLRVTASKGGCAREYRVRVPPVAAAGELRVALVDGVLTARIPKAALAQPTPLAVRADAPASCGAVAAAAAAADEHIDAC